MILTGKQYYQAKLRVTKNGNIDIWVNDISNQLIIRSFYTDTKILKNDKVVTGKTPFFVVGPFCTHRSISLNTGF